MVRKSIIGGFIFNATKGCLPGSRGKEDAELSKGKEPVESANAESLAPILSLELSEQTQQQVYIQQHQPPSETQQNLPEPKGVVGGGGASTESDWVISIIEKLDLARQDDTEPSIYKVPQHLREVDDKAYVPHIVSLGPYHHGKEGLHPMERHKLRALKFFLKRKNLDIKIYLYSIKELEWKARSCYEGPINMTSSEFGWMLVLDGCFVLELIRVALGGLEDQLDTVFAARVLMNLKLIQRDMIMLENQIPLFILDRLLGLQLDCPDQRGRVAELAVNFFRKLIPAGESLTKSDQNRSESSPEVSTAFDPLSHQRLHFLDVFRLSLLRTWPGPVTRSSGRANRAADKHPLKPIHCVTELRDAGIKFKKRVTHRFWDIKFENGVLEILRLVIDDDTKSLLLNVIAFEQCHLDCTNRISSYVLFMDHLINSSEDVRHLHHCGILEHWLGSDDKVAEIFNRLCQEVDFDIDDSYFSGLSNEVNSYYSQRWHAWIADLRHKYFSNPWATISVIAGAVLLLLTLIQTFYAVYGYYRPNKA